MEESEDNSQTPQAPQAPVVNNQLQEYRQRMAEKRRQNEEEQKSRAQTPQPSDENGVQAQLLQQQPQQMNQLQDGRPLSNSTVPPQSESQGLLQPQPDLVYAPPIIPTLPPPPQFVPDNSRFDSTIIQPPTNPHLENVSISNVPTYKIYDLTNKSDNLKKLQSGTEVYDLESQILVDDKINDMDLLILEQEVNKFVNRRRKTANAGGPNALGAQGQVINHDSGRVFGNNQPPVPDENVRAPEQQYEEQLLPVRGPPIAQGPGGPQMQNQGAQLAPIAEWTRCCGHVRRHPTGYIDVFCMKELDCDFVQMFIFVSSLTFFVVLYAAV